MNADEESRAQRGVNICDYYSRMWFAQSCSLFAVFFAILYISCLIVYECYVRITEMNRVVTNDAFNAVAACAPCHAFKFNMKMCTVNENDVVMKLIPTIEIDTIFVQGASSWHLLQDVIYANISSPCPSIVIWSTPKLYDGL